MSPTNNNSAAVLSIPSATGMEAGVDLTAGANQTPSCSINTTADERKWLRVDEAMRLYSIGRTKLYELIKDGSIRSASLRKPHQIRGSRRVLASSIAAYFDSLATGGLGE